MRTYAFHSAHIALLVRAVGKLVCALVVAVVLLGRIPAAQAATIITVTTTADEIVDNGVCSLREALQAANTNQAVGGCPAGSDGEDTIKLGAGTYTLTRTNQDGQGDTTGDWNITSDLVIQGAGSSKTVIDADHKDRIFRVSAERVTINSVTLRNGKTADSYTNGGGIYLDHGILMASDLVVTTSDGGSGGAVFVNRGATLSMGNSTITYNNAVEGGGIYNLGDADVQRTVFHDNHTRFESPTDVNGNIGGAVYNLGELRLIEDTIDNNTSNYGGGVYSSSETGSRAFIYESTVSNNRAIDGGGIANRGLMIIGQSTISGNRATNNGGGVNNDSSCFPGCPGVVSINSTTIANNRANSDSKGTGDGGGIYNASYDNGNRVRVSNTILGKNYDGGNQAPDCAGSISSYGYNIIASTKGCTLRNINEGNKLNVDPKLSSLASNGGRTKTHALKSGSPAIDAGNPNTDDVQYGCGGFDQRGVNRPQDGNGDGKARCDIGAYERTPSGKKTVVGENDAPVPTVAPVQTDPTVETIIPDTGAGE